jgi:hypothetical protein
MWIGPLSLFQRTSGAAVVLPRGVSLALTFPALPAATLAFTGGATVTLTFEDTE